MTDNVATTQPPRLATDGAVSVERVALYHGAEGLLVTVTDGDTTASVHMGIHNAWRIFGLLAFMLGIQLPSKLVKAIRM